MSNNQIDYDAIRQRAEERVNQRKEFVQHLTAFVIVNLGLWGIWVATYSGNFPWPIFVTGGWGIGLVMHGIEVYYKAGMESAVQREIDRELRLRGLDASDVYSKPKRDQTAQTVRLSDDGELVPADDEEADSQEAPRRRARIK